jgi:hypothetical protein
VAAMLRGAAESKVTVNGEAPAAPESGLTCQDLCLPESAGEDDGGKHERYGHVEVTQLQVCPLYHPSTFAPSYSIILLLSCADTLHSFIRSALRRKRHSAPIQPCLRAGFTARLASSAQGHTSGTLPSLALSHHHACSITLRLCLSRPPLWI